MTPPLSHASDQKVTELETRIETLTQLLAEERNQRMECDTQFKKMMDKFSQVVCISMQT